MSEKWIPFHARFTPAKCQCCIIFFGTSSIREPNISQLFSIIASFMSARFVKQNRGCEIIFTSFPYLEGVTDLQTRFPPICKCHLITTLAAVLPYFWPIFRISGWCSTSYPVLGGPDVIEPAFSQGRSADPRELYACIQRRSGKTESCKHFPCTF